MVSRKLIWLGRKHSRQRQTETRIQGVQRFPDLTGKTDFKGEEKKELNKEIEKVKTDKTKHEVKTVKCGPRMTQTKHNTKMTIHKNKEGLILLRGREKQRSTH